LCHPLGDLGVTYTVHLWLLGKRVVDFILALIELFSLALTVEALWSNIGLNCVVRKGWVTLSANFRGKGGHPPTNFGFKKLESLAISLSRGVVCVILRLAVLIQYRRVTHRHTHRQTDTRWWLLPAHSAGKNQQWTRWDRHFGTVSSRLAHRLLFGPLFSELYTVFSERDTYVHVRYMLSAVRLSVCRLFVTLVHPTQAVELFGNFFFTTR